MRWLIQVPCSRPCRGFRRRDRYTRWPGRCHCTRCGLVHRRRGLKKNGAGPPGTCAAWIFRRPGRAGLARLCAGGVAAENARGRRGRCDRDFLGALVRFARLAGFAGPGPFCRSVLPVRFACFAPRIRGGSLNRLHNTQWTSTFIRTGSAMAASKRHSPPAVSRHWATSSRSFHSGLPADRCGPSCNFW